MYRVVLRSIAKLAMTSMFLFPFSLSAQALEVYLFRGAGDLSFVNKNLHFSRGLDRIAETMNREGIYAEVRRFEAIDDAMRTIRERRPETVAFIGHSMGALASMNMARRMRAEGIRVAYIGLIDIPGPVGIAGDNVEWAENFYSIHPVYGRLTNTSSHPRAENIHVTGFIHNRMDDSPFVQNKLLTAVRQIHFEEQLLKKREQERLHALQSTQQPGLNAQDIPVYTPPLPQGQSGFPRVVPDNGVYGIDQTVTTSIKPGHATSEDENLLSRAGRFIVRLKERSRIQKRSHISGNNR